MSRYPPGFSSVLDRPSLRKGAYRYPSMADGDLLAGTWGIRLDQLHIDGDAVRNIVAVSEGDKFAGDVCMALLDVMI